VQVFDTTGAYLRQFGGVGNGLGELNGPNSLAIDSGGNVWVTETGVNQRLQKFDNAGNAIKTVDGFDFPRFLAFDGADNLFVSNHFATEYQVFDAAGNPLGSLSLGERVGGIDVGPDGNVYFTRRTTTGLGFIYGANTNPTASDDAYSTDFGAALSVPAPGVLGNDSDGEGDGLVAGLVDDVEHGNLTLNPDGSFTYTPTAGYVGNDSFTYTADDGQARVAAFAPSSPATVTITVLPPPNVAPVAQNDAYNAQGSLTVGAALGVLANDSDANGDALTVAIDSGPRKGALALSPDGAFTYTPRARFSGTDSFTYVVSDGVETDTGSVAITVARCSYGVDPATAEFAVEGGVAVFDVLTTDQCEWFAKSRNRWITVDNAVRTGPGTVVFTVDANTKRRARTGKVAVDVSGTNPIVEVTQAGTGSVLPLPPTDVTIQVRRKVNLIVRWTDGADNEEGFVVTRTSPGDTTENFTLGRNKTKLKDKGLKLATEYCYEVAAFNAQGSSSTALGCATTGAARVATGLHAESSPATSIELTWYEEADVRQLLERREPGQPRWDLISSIAAGEASYEDGTAELGVPYEYRVRTCFTGACDAVSNVVRAVVVAGPAEIVPAPRDLPVPRYSTVPTAARPMDDEAPELPPRSVVRIYKDADPFWAERSGDEVALLDAGYVRGVSLFVHPLDDLMSGVPSDTAVVMLPSTHLAAARRVDSAEAQSALADYLDTGGVLIVHQGMARYRVPVQLRGVQMRTFGAYTRVAIPVGQLLLTEEAIEYAPEAIAAAIEALVSAPRTRTLDR